VAASIKNNGASLNLIGLKQKTTPFFAEIDGLKGLVESGDITIEQAQARFMELLGRHRLVGERLLAVARAWGATPGNA
jgi:hypothetical protein